MWTSGHMMICPHPVTGGSGNKAVDPTERAGRTLRGARRRPASGRLRARNDGRAGLRWTAVHALTVGEDAPAPTKAACDRDRGGRRRRTRHCSALRAGMAHGFAFQFSSFFSYSSHFSLLTYLFIH